VTGAAGRRADEVAPRGERGRRGQERR
jgi:hypothetical protein